MSISICVIERTLNAIYLFFLEQITINECEIESYLLFNKLNNLVYLWATYKNLNPPVKANV